MQQTTESPASAGPATTVEGRCPGHVRSAVGTGELAFSFDGEDLRAFLEALFDEYDVREMILAGTEAEATARDWTSSRASGRRTRPATADDP